MAIRDVLSQLAPAVLGVAGTALGGPIGGAIGGIGGNYLGNYLNESKGNNNMPISKGIINHYLRRAKEYGLPESHPVIQRIKRGDKAAANELDNFFKKVYETKEGYDPYKDKEIGVTKYGQAAMPGHTEPEATWYGGKEAWRENIPTRSPQQESVANNLLGLGQEGIQNVLQRTNQNANMGFLDELLGQGSSKGFENLLGTLGEYAPNALSSGLGAAVGGGGLGGILQALIGSAAGDYTRKNVGQSPMFNNISEGIGNYYNQGVNALGDLYHNRGQFRR